MGLKMIQDGDKQERVGETGLEYLDMRKFCAKWAMYNLSKIKTN